MKLIVLALLAGSSSPAAAQLPAEALEAWIEHLYSLEMKGRASAAARWNTRPPPDDVVFVLQRESLEPAARISFDQLVASIGRLTRRGVPVRWCQRGCPIQGGDQRVEVHWIVPHPPNAYVLRAEIFGHGSQRDENGAVTSWLHLVDVHVMRRNGGWEVDSRVGYFADYRATRPASRSHPARP